MPSAPLPPTEALRLKALEEYYIFDTAPEQAFDDLVELAGYIANTPIALMSLIDTNRQWFKARKGIDATETHRSSSMCAYAILKPDSVLHVPDASIDPRFSDNPLVTGAPRIRLYAGAPIVAPNGIPLGTICVIDTEARSLSEEILAQLSRIARQAIALLEFRKKGREIVQIARQLERTNEDLLASQKDLDNAMAARRNLFLRMRNEFHDPIQTILRNVDHIAKQPAAQVLRAEAVSVEESAQRLRKVVDTVFDYVQLEKGLVTLDPVAFPSVDFFRGLIAPYFRRAAAKGLSLKMEVLGVLPPTLTADKTHIKQALGHLLDNAIKFTSEGHITFSVIGAVANQPLESLTFRITDTGKGIPEELRGGDFFALAPQASNRESSGLGLGVGIASQLVRLMGGTIRWSDAPDHPGTEVTVLVPIATSAPVSYDMITEEPTQGTLVAETGTPIATVKSLAGKRILIVEDHPLNQKVARTIVERLGATADVVGNGPAALEALLHAPYDAVLMDCELPILDGYEVTRQVRQREHGQDKHLLIIAMTASLGHEERERCFRAGMDDYIPKPVTALEIERIFGSWFS